MRGPFIYVHRLNKTSPSRPPSTTHNLLDVLHLVDNSSQSSLQFNSTQTCDTNHSSHVIHAFQGQFQFCLDLELSQQISFHQTQTHLITKSTVRSEVKHLTSNRWKIFFQRHRFSFGETTGQPVSCFHLRAAAVAGTVSVHPSISSSHFNFACHTLVSHNHHNHHYYRAIINPTIAALPSSQQLFLAHFRTAFRA